MREIMGDNIWRPSKKKYGVAICNYSGTDAGTISLNVGETVHIFEEYGSGPSAWYRGTSMKNKEKKGIFPACLIHIKPCTVDNEGLYETLTPVEDPMVKEVAYVLREWSGIWKQLFVGHRLQEPMKNSPLFDSVTMAMRELLEHRGQLVDKKLTQEDARDVKDNIINLIDWGNGQLGMDLVPRIDGEQVDADTCSITQLHRVHVHSAKLAQQDKPGQRRKTKNSKGEVVSESGISTHHLLASFKHFGCNVQDSSETLLSLYQYKDGKYFCITEKFAVKHSKMMVPEDTDKINNCFGLFTDLTSEDLERELFLVAHIYRVGKMVFEHSKKMPTSAYKRPWGVAVASLNLARLPGNFKDWEFQMRVSFCGELNREKEFTSLHETLIRQLQQGSSPSGSSNKPGHSLTISIRILHGDLATVRKEDPMLFSKGVAIVQKLGHSDVITPGEVRNDLYVTLASGEFDRGSKTAQKNVEVKVSVYDSQGNIIKDCITYGGGEAAQTNYKTAVFYHSNRPEWNETIRISVPIDIFPGSHVCFELFHCSVKTKEVKKPFGLAYFNVTNKDRIVIKDDHHDLCMYKVDSKHMLTMKQYRALPFLKHDINDSSRLSTIPRELVLKYNDTETLTVATVLCSGKFTQNNDLLGILSWRSDQHHNQLSANLAKLRRMQGEEIVKFLAEGDLLDALFEMLSEETVVKSHSQEVFSSMVYIFTLIHHARFEMFKPLLETYITDTFAAPLVHKPLSQCFSKMMLEECTGGRKQNMTLLQAFSVIDYIFKFIVQSRQLQMKNVYSISSSDAAEFKENIGQLFSSMADLLASTSKNLNSHQVAMLSNLHLCYTPLLQVISQVELSQLIYSCLTAMADPAQIPEDITKAKLQLCCKTVKTNLFTNDSSRRVLLELVLVEIRDCLKLRKQVSLCVELLGDVMDCIFKLRQQFDSTRLVAVGNDNVKEDIQKVLSSIFDAVMETVLDLNDRNHSKKLSHDHIPVIKTRKTSTVDPKPALSASVQRSRSCVTDLKSERRATTIVRTKTHSESPPSGAGLTVNVMEYIGEDDLQDETVFLPHKTSSDDMLTSNVLKPASSILDMFVRKSPKDKDALPSPALKRRGSRSRSPQPRTSDPFVVTSSSSSSSSSVGHGWQKDPTTTGALIACLTEMLRLMDDEHYQALLHVQHRGEPLKKFLINILTVFKLLVQPNVFPKDWTMMRMVTNNVVFTAIEYFSEALKENYMADSRFSEDLWSSYFNLAVAFIIQPSLQLNRYSEAKAQKLKDRYGDMRVLMGVQVETLWHSLERHKQHFIPSMIGQFLQLTLVPEREVRKATLPVLTDMMATEQRRKGHFKMVEASLIERLDYFLTQQHIGDAEYKDLFKEKLLEQVKSEPSLQEGGTQFIISVTHLLERLLDYRQVVDGEENKDKRMHCTFNILNFYKDEIQREEMYIRYVNKLHELHMLAHNHVEAGLTLRLYAQILAWSTRDLPAEMRYSAQRECDRREMLYTQIINCFDKGKVWEYALPMCKDLAEYYERNLDYRKLGDILKQQASFYQKILEGEPSDDQFSADCYIPRQDPSYYMVSYVGHSFPAYVRNKQFIYRGDECLKLETIMNHLTAEFPAAQIKPQSEKIKEDDQQYIQICSVKTIAGERAEFRGRDVPLEIRNFYNVNEVDTFQFDRPYHRGKKCPENESKTLCIERIKWQTAYKFPGILRWYEIVKEEVEHLCPIAVAIDQVKQANIDLQILVHRCQANHKLFFGQLSMKLNGMIQAAVNGGISKFHDAFFNKEFDQEHPDEVKYLDKLQGLLLEQVDILKRGMTIHGRLAPTDLQPLHKNLDVELKKMGRSVMDHASPRGSIISVDSTHSIPELPPHKTSSSTSLSSTGSDRLSTTAEEIEDHLYNICSFDKSRRNLLLEGGCSSQPPPIPERPRSMYNPEQGLQTPGPLQRSGGSDSALGRLPGTRSDVSDASLLSKTVPAPIPSLPTGGAKHYRPMSFREAPPLPPTKVRRPSDHERHSRTPPNIFTPPKQQQPMIPDTSETDGPPPDIPAKRERRNTILNDSPIGSPQSRPSTLQSPAAATGGATEASPSGVETRPHPGPPPALPPRKPSMSLPHTPTQAQPRESTPDTPDTVKSPTVPIRPAIPTKRTSIMNNGSVGSIGSPPVGSPPPLPQSPGGAAKSVPPLPRRVDTTAKKVPPLPTAKPSVPSRDHDVTKL